MADTSKSVEFTHPFKVAKLPEGAATTFDLTPTEAEAEGIARTLDATSVKKVRFVGEIALQGSDWVLVGELGATVTQPCVVTLEPVRTRVDVSVRRRYTNAIPEATASESEIPEDEELEPLTATIDPARVAIEALALELPDYPRAEGVSLDDAVYGPPGVDPLRDEDVKPFAGLAALKEKLEKGE